MIENLYLLYSHYGIEDRDEETDIIFKAARRAYRDFCRRVSFQGKVPVDQRNVFERKVEDLLVCEIPALLATNSQKEFDEKHHEICQRVIQVYSDTGGQSYGIAQRWVNQTLMYLAVIEKNLYVGDWNMEEKRKYFHVPIEQYLIEKLSDTIKLKFEVVPKFEFLDYEKYVYFQAVIRDNINSSSSYKYRDPLDWAFHVYLKIAQLKINKKEQ